MPACAASVAEIGFTGWSGETAVEADDAPGQQGESFKAAIEHNRRAGALPWIAHTLKAYATMLKRGSGETDGRRRDSSWTRRASSARRSVCPD